MSRELTARSTLETLKKEAKRWLKALQAGDAEARRRLLAATPVAPAKPGLRDVQFALAREHGLPGWAVLCQALEDARRSYAERVELVLRAADWQAARSTGAPLLARWPEMGQDSLYAAAATGDLAEVERRLAADPTGANRRGGPLDREPLLYLAYSTLPGSEVHGLEIARLLLDHGADPNARWIGPWGEPAFTVLTGMIGEGEGDQPPHPQAKDLAALLIERGADPFDPQALYNTSITRDDTGWLDFLWNQSERYGRLEAWREEDPEKAALGGSEPLYAPDYLLRHAAALDHVWAGGSGGLVERVVGHGADTDRPTTRVGGGAMGYAVHFGRKEIAAYLAPLSRDVHHLTSLGFKNRLAELFAADPSLVNARHGRIGCTPLFELPADEAPAIEIAAFLLGHGAAPNIRDPEDGLTVEQRLRRHGLIELADFLRDEVARPAVPTRDPSY